MRLINNIPIRILRASVVVIRLIQCCSSSVLPAVSKARLALNKLGHPRTGTKENFSENERCSRSG